MNCPLCEQSVHYIGLNTIECSGVGCANYKEPPITERIKQSLEFDNTLVDWDWMVLFAKWWSQKLGYSVYADRGVGFSASGFVVTVPGYAQFYISDLDTRRAIYNCFCDSLPYGPTMRGLERMS